MTRLLVRPVADLHPAAGDCELLRAKGLAQPANTLSSLAYALAGALIWSRGADVPGARHHAVAVLANGLGGIGFHGSGDRLSHWIHDVALVDTIASMALGDAGLVAGTPFQRRSAHAGAATGAAAAVLAVRPDATNVLTALAAAAAGSGGLALARAGLLSGRRGRARTAAAFALLAGAFINLRSRTGGRWCRPNARLQGHAAWHILTALALAAWAEGERLQGQAARRRWQRRADGSAAQGVPRNPFGTVPVAGCADRGPLGPAALSRRGDTDEDAARTDAGARPGGAAPAAGGDRLRQRGRHSDPGRDAG